MTEIFLIDQESFENDMAADFKRPFDPGNQGTLQEIDIQNQIEDPWLESSIFEIGLPPLDSEAASFGARPPLIKRRRGYIHAENVKSLLGQVKRISPATAGNVQGPSARQRP